MNHESPSSTLPFKPPRPSSLHSRYTRSLSTYQPSRFNRARIIRYPYTTLLCEISFVSMRSSIRWSWWVSWPYLALASSRTQPAVRSTSGSVPDTRPEVSAGRELQLAGASYNFCSTCNSYQKAYTSFESALNLETSKEICHECCAQISPCDLGFYQKSAYVRSQRFVAETAC